MKEDFKLWQIFIIGASGLFGSNRNLVLDGCGMAILN
jgi:hypothetical protein